MNKKLIVKILILLFFILSGVFIYIFKDSLAFTDYITDRELLQKKLDSFGLMAPFVYMFIQMLQVLIAPVPGEMTGLVGGYLFGGAKGFIYSSIALTLGSVINFSIARYAGRDIIKRLVPDKQWKRFNLFFEEDGTLFILALFLFPGFPKDYFCLFLGITNLRVSLFILFASIGRMPGTLLLSVQGELISQGDYFITVLLAVVVGGLSFLLIFFRKRIYRFLKKREK